VIAVGWDGFRLESGVNNQNMFGVAVSSDNTQQPRCRQQWLVSNSSNNNNASKVTGQG
jgi:hypothetical protein